MPPRARKPPAPPPPPCFGFPGLPPLGVAAAEAWSWADDLSLADRLLSAQAAGPAPPPPAARRTKGVRAVVGVVPVVVEEAVADRAEEVRRKERNTTRIDAQCAARAPSAPSASPASSSLTLPRTLTSIPGRPRSRSAPHEARPARPPRRRYSPRTARRGATST